MPSYLYSGSRLLPFIFTLFGSGLIIINLHHFHFIHWKPLPGWLLMSSSRQEAFLAHLDLDHPVGDHGGSHRVKYGQLQSVLLVEEIRTCSEVVNIIHTSHFLKSNFSHLLFKETIYSPPPSHSRNLNGIHWHQSSPCRRCKHLSW